MRHQRVAVTGFDIFSSTHGSESIAFCRLGKPSGGAMMPQGLMFT
jgi:hypothetical protein